MSTSSYPARAQVCAVLAIPEALAAIQSPAPVGIAISATAMDQKTLLQFVEATRPQVVLLHHKFPGLTPYLAQALRHRYQCAAIYLVDAEEYDERERAIKGQPYPLATIGEAETFGCPLVASWPVQSADPERAREIAELTDLALTMLESTAWDGQAERGAQVSTGRVYALRGDVSGGKSEIAINLACALGLRAGRRVALLDFDPIKPALHRMLGLDSLQLGHIERLLDDAARGMGGINVRDSKYMTPYPTGARVDGEGQVDVLTGVTGEAGAAQLADDSVDRLRQIIAALRQRYQDIIIDLGTNSGSPMHEYICSIADIVLVVTPPMPEAIDAVARGHDTLANQHKVRAENCRLVINGVVDPDIELRHSDLIRQMGGMQVGGVIALDPRLVRKSRAMSEVPVMREDAAARGSAFVRDIDLLIETCIVRNALPVRERNMMAQVRAFFGLGARKQPPTRQALPPAARATDLPLGLIQEERYGA